MKDQYFGDVNDYRKYGLLRAILAASEFRLGVCWMLTAPDGRSDGRHLAYLDQPTRFRHFDPELFDWLRRTLRDHPDRRIAHVEASKLLSNAVFFAEILRDGHAARDIWFTDCRSQLSGCDLIFFDPDNGLERSVPFGRRDSHKYLYWAEVRGGFSTGASVLIYQHFPREQREAYIAKLAERLRAETGAPAVFSFSTPFVLFLLAANGQHAAGFREAVELLSRSWPGTQISGREVHPGSGALPVG